MKPNFKIDLIDEPIPHVSHGDHELGSRWKPYRMSELVEAETGKSIDPERWKEIQKRQELKRWHDSFIQANLEEAGIEVEKETDIAYIGAVTGLSRPHKQLRNINMLMQVAERNRREQLLSLTKYLEEHENGQYARYMVITSGQRVPAGGDLQGRIRGLGRQLSRWAFEVKELFDIEVVARIIELPRDHKTGSYHPHANVVIIPPYLGAGQWETFLAFTREFFKTWVKDAKQINDLNEVIKYVFKGEDLWDMKPAETAWLYHTLYNTNIFSAFQEYRDFRRELKEGRKKLVMLNGKVVYVWKPKCHRLRGQSEELDELQREVDRDRAGGIKNVLLTEIAPTSMLSPFKEPVLVVMGYDPSVKPGSRAFERLIDIRQAQYEAHCAWEANTTVSPETARTFAEAVNAGATNVVPLGAAKQGGEADQYIVHTSTITVRDPEPPDRGTKLHLVDPPPDQDQSGAERQTERAENDQIAPASEVDFLAIFGGERVL